MTSGCFVVWQAHADRDAERKCAENRLASACVVAEELLGRLEKPQSSSLERFPADWTDELPREVKSGAASIARPSSLRVSLQPLNYNKIDERSGHGHGQHGGLSAAAARENAGSVALRGRLARLKEAQISRIR